jgi:hypothetical protein
MIAELPTPARIVDVGPDVTYIEAKLDAPIGETVMLYARPSPGHSSDFTSGTVIAKGRIRVDHAWVRIGRPVWVRRIARAA